MTRVAASSPAHCSIGIDIGGTKIAAGVVQFPEGRVIARQVQPTRPERGGHAVLTDVAGLARALLQKASGQGVRTVAIGLGIAELIGVDGRVLSEATIKWKDINVRDRLHAETGLPVTLDADVRASARGEANFGSGRDFRTFLYVTIGTGISAALVQDRIPYAGARGLTGTFASSPGMIPGSDGKLACGPALEAYAAGPALASRFTVLCSDFAGNSADVVNFAEAGNSLAQSVVDSAGRAAGAAIANLVNMLDPEAVVIGGGLGATDGYYRKSLLSALRMHIWSEHHRDLPVRSAELGNDSGIIGAALAAQYHPG